MSWPFHKHHTAHIPVAEQIKEMGFAYTGDEHEISAMIAEWSVETDGWRGDAWDGTNEVLYYENGYLPPEWTVLPFVALHVFLEQLSQL